MGDRTSEPWEVHWSIEGQSWSVLKDEDGHMIANIFESEANARFIAAAPDLLEMLEGIVRMIKVQDVLEPWELGLARAALAKARGETLEEYKKMTMQWNHPSIQEAMIDYEKAALVHADAEARLKASKRRLLVMLDVDDNSIWGSKLDGYIECWRRVMLETRSNDATP